MSRALKWPGNVPVATKLPRDSGYPTCYKIDVANVKLKIAIEIDGASHCLESRKVQDRKKEMFLRDRGWIVLRFKNREVMNDLNACVKKVREAVEARKH